MITPNLHGLKKKICDMKKDGRFRKILDMLRGVRRLSNRGVYYFHHKMVTRRYLKEHTLRKIQIGSGRYALNSGDWLNTDFDSTREVVYLDATKPLRFKDGTIDYIFHEHFLEHFSYPCGVAFTKECYRILKPGGKLRIATPDLRFLVDLYCENKTELQEQYIRWATDTFLPYMQLYSDVAVINNYFRDWGHQFIYDFKTLKKMLEDCGFCHIVLCELGASEDTNLRGLEIHESQVGRFNQLETMVVEAIK
jgi:predicted SAM-dependent methyltransferase